MSAADLDPRRHRLKAWMLLTDGTEWPLGVFLFSEYSQPRYRYGIVPQATLLDQLVVLDIPTARPAIVPAGADVYDALMARLAKYPLPGGYVVEPTEARLSDTAAMVWPPGTSEVVILTELAAKAGFYSPYFDNNGVLRIEAPKPADGTSLPDHIYDGTGRVDADSVVVSDDTVGKPNRWLVVDTSATDTPVVGWYDLPVDDPDSFQSVGRRIVEKVDVQSVGTYANAELIATAAAKRYRTSVTAQFSSPIDPRHDTFDVVRLFGDYYREKAWSITCEEGTAMTHEARRSYA